MKPADLAEPEAPARTRPALPFHMSLVGMGIVFALTTTLRLPVAPTTEQISHMLLGDVEILLKETGGQHGTTEEVVSATETVQRLASSSQAADTRGVTSTADSVAGRAEPTFPTTKFTPHIEEVLSHVKFKGTITNKFRTCYGYDPQFLCANNYRLVVHEPYSSVKAVECNIKDNSFCSYLQHLFQDSIRTLPYNVSLGISRADMVKPKATNWGHCFASSSPNGMFAMNNFQDIAAQTQYVTTTPTVSIRQIDLDRKREQEQNTIPWDRRSRVPIFRGHPRFNVRGFSGNRCETLDLRDLGHRPAAAAWSLDHPDLLDAAVSLQPHVCLQHNATNGMDRLLGLGKYKDLAQSNMSAPRSIPPSEYYNNYQVAVVLAGIGAAFRTTNHLRAGQAVVLQDYFFVEWFTPFMKPYVHYIPLRRDLSDLNETMHWVRDNPDKVEEIAKQGQDFYHEYLSFANNDEHWYELIWRLSVHLHDGNDKISPEDWKGLQSGEGIWMNIPASRFVRASPNGTNSFVLERS